MEGYHKSVLTKEVLDFLNIKKGSWYLDCTLGDGGHSLWILKLGGKVVGIDVDPKALERARVRLQVAGYPSTPPGASSGQFKLIQGNFREIKFLVSQTEIKGQKFAGAIFDLGVSSLQLEDPQRGFSFLKSGPLDMRMDSKLAVTALDLINALSRKELYELFNSLGEEKYSKQLADALVSAREVVGESGKLASRSEGKGVRNTKDLADLMVEVYRRAGIKHWKIHPATKVFQALRIAVNDELSALSEGLEQVKDVIEKNGYIVVLSFHSLEDRIVKNTFRKWKDMEIGEIITKKPIAPGEEEVMENFRSRSAKMRIFKVS